MTANRPANFRVMEPQRSEIPTFAVIGQPNEGKTSVLATLLEDDQAPISPMPGTTTKAIRYPAILDDEELFVFWDTPGFQNPGAVLDWCRTQDRRTENLASKFIEEFRHDPVFAHECGIFFPLAGGAAAIYVVDAARGIRDVDRHEIEILRLCGNPRIGIINSKSDDAAHLDEWHQLLARDFNHRREFNALYAGFDHRMKLLEAVKSVIPEWELAIETGINALRIQWNARAEQAANAIIHLLEDCVRLEATSTLQDRGEAEQAKTRAQDKLHQRIRKREAEFRSEVRRLYRHHEEHWSMPDIVAQDIFSEIVWKFFGLTRTQLLTSSVLAGAVSGGTIDLFLGGSSFLVGTAIGGGAGAAGAWLAANKAVETKVLKADLGRWTLPGILVNPEQARARIDPKSNFIWVLLDRAVFYTQVVMARAHGKRSSSLEAISAPDEKQGATSKWGSSLRSDVGRFAHHFRNGHKSSSSEQLSSIRAKLRNQLVSEVRSLV